MRYQDMRLMAPLPPGPVATQDPVVRDYLAALSRWSNDTGVSLSKLNQSLRRILNSGVEFPSVFGEAGAGGNLRIAYRQMSLTLPVADCSPAVAVLHGLERPARGWFPILWQNDGTVVLDNILSSDYPNPFNLATSYPTLDVTAERTLTGGVAAANGWVSSDVRVGDEIWVGSVFTPAETATVAVDSDEVTRVGGASWKDIWLPGWKVRFPSAAPPLSSRDGWREILEVKSGDSLLVADPLPAALTAQPVELLATSGWHKITEVTSNAGGDTLTLDPKGSPCSIPVGNTGCYYSIRRPSTDRLAWIRVIPATTTQFVNLTLAFV